MARQMQRSRMGTSRRGGGFKSRSRTVTRFGPTSRRSIVKKQRAHKGDAIVRTSFGFPDLFETTLPYADTFTLTTAAAGTAVSKYYSMNGCYDPDPALGGAQPMWFDQFTAVYDRYTVLRARAKVTFMVAAGTTTANIGPWSCGVITDRNTTSASTNPAVLIEAQNSNAKHLSGDYKEVVCTATYSPWTSLGKTSWDDSIAGSVSSNPGSGWWVGAWAATYGTTGATDVRCVIEIQYDVRFFSVNDNAGS